MKFDYKVYDNKIEITPQGGVEDNCVYEIKIRNVRDKLDRKDPISSLEHSVMTRLSPSHSNLGAVRTVVDRPEVSDHDILYYIREASLFAEYITGEEYKEEQAPYKVKQFVKFRAAYDSLLKFYTEKAAEAGRRGTLSEITFEHSNRFPDIKDLLDSIKGEVDYWYEHLKGIGLGGATPRAGMKGSGFYDTYLFDYSRKLTDERSRRNAVVRRRY